MSVDCKFPTAAARRDHIDLLVLIALALLIFTACTRAASKPPAGYATANAPSVTIDQVQVNEGSGIYVRGHSSLPNGECVKTELLADDRPVTWWPKDICIEVDSGQWEILAALGQKDAPVTLDTNVKYMVHAWWPRQPEQSSTRFPFDPNGQK